MIGPASGRDQTAVRGDKRSAVRLGDREVDRLVDGDSEIEREPKRAILEKSSRNQGHRKSAKRRPQTVGGLEIASAASPLVSEDVPEFEAQESGSHESEVAR